MVCDLLQFFERSWMWDAYQRAFDHGPPTHYLFIPKPFLHALKTAEQRFLADQTLTVLDEDMVLYLLQKVGGPGCPQAQAAAVLTCEGLCSPQPR